MKLIMTLLVRNEEDILALNLDFHLNQGVNLIIVMDHLSDDGTRDILEDYAKQGVVEILEQTNPGYYQGRWVTEMARRACTIHAADWIINGDADEFWFPVEGTLHSTLVATKSDIMSLKRYNFPPLKDAEPGEFYESMIFRDTASVNGLGRPLLGKCCHRADPEVVVHQGNHWVAGPTLSKSERSSAIEILHFPMRSFSQFDTKIRLGGRAYQTSPELDPRMGGVWRKLHRLQQNQGLEEYYQDQCMDRAEAERLCNEGRLEVDERLSYFLEHARRSEHSLA